MSRIEDRVCERIQERAQRGLEKYGMTVEREDLSLYDWVAHTQEELLDGAVYLEVIREILGKPEGLADALDRLIQNADFQNDLHRDLIDDLRAVLDRLRKL